MDKGDVEMLDVEKNVPSSYDLVSNESPVKCESIAEDKTHYQSNSKREDFKNARNETEDQLNSKIQPEAHDNVVLENKTPTIDAGTDDMVSGYPNLTDDEVHNIDEGEVNEVHQSEKMIYEDPQIESNPTTITIDGDARLCEFPKVKLEVTDSANVDSEDDEGSPEDQAAFLGKLGTFYWEKAMEFKPPRFYGHQLNCLKLWRSVIRLSGYDQVTGYKLWRQMGDSFNPPSEHLVGPGYFCFSSNLI
ncbi:AT-rich interactive domain-containing protein 5-like [Solanum stenotomum]|uniref:AT-rich interactive domain-containing protein 5-like n=1 Tax=Solanum stenotomum TaxID=172797 RepID=UPI0020D0CF0E|nr:AT-rich interactive domain-containing protein 5-like [Solanum stenotomum]